MANNKNKIPDNFKGVIAVLWSGVIDRGENDYEKGNVVDFVEYNSKDGKDLTQAIGKAVWDDPRFEVVFMDKVTAAEVQGMVEPLKDDVYLKRKIAKRKFKYDLDDVKLKSKAVWSKTDIVGTVKEREIKIAERPDDLVIT
jgi:hypothetical protein